MAEGLNWKLHKKYFIYREVDLRLFASLADKEDKMFIVCASTQNISLYAFGLKERVLQPRKYHGVTTKKVLRHEQKSTMESR